MRSFGGEAILGDLMKFATAVLLAVLSAAALGLTLAVGTYADNRQAPGKQSGNESASTGSSEPAGTDKDRAFKQLDLDGDGAISKAEAAGTPLILGFDRADKDRDGKLSRAEYDAIGKPEAKPEARSKTKAQARSKVQTR